MKYYKEYQQFLPEINSPQMQKLEAFFNILIGRGVEYGVVGAAPSDEEFWLRHIADSLFILQKGLSAETLRSAGYIYDVGSGAGLPGIVLAIMNEAAQVTLIDSSEKRIKFAMDACLEIGLSNVKFINRPAEEFHIEQIEQGIKPVITFRAFRKPLASLELVLNILKKCSNGGKVLYWRSRPFMKTRNMDEDISIQEYLKNDAEAIQSRVKNLGYTKVLFYKLQSPEKLGSRGYYFFEHSGKIGKGYPRSWARIKNDSLVERTV